MALLINCQKNPVLSLVILRLHLQVLPEWPVRSKLLSWHCKVMWPFRVTSTVPARSHFPPNYNAQLRSLSFIIMLIWRDFHAIFGLLIPKERGKFLWTQFKGERSIFRMKVRILQRHNWKTTKDKLRWLTGALQILFLPVFKRWEVEPFWFILIYSYAFWLVATMYLKLKWSFKQAFI